VGRSLRLVVVMLVAALALAACGRGRAPTAAAPDASAPTVVDDGSLSAGQKIAAPKGRVVLTVTGDIATANQGGKLELDLASLERMRQVRLEAAEPFLKRRVTYEGVLLADLLAVAGVPGSATTVSVTALDDYTVEFKISDVRSSQMVLATRADGRRMPVDRSGPVRIVFPDSSALGRNPDLWIWSVSTMRVA
jgi:hypothetical protein